ncbi:PAP13 [Symbiodinium sp. CCMP2592]|nr:PAP13 [Symbiodinium sp. CCMP2592]
MGVPMLRPSPSSPGLPSILALNPAWLDIFRFCSIRDLGASLAVDRNWRAAGDSHHVWADAYDRTQRVDDSSAPSGENLLRSLIERPFGEDAVGWHVAVLAEDHGYSNERYYTGWDSGREACAPDSHEMQDESLPTVPKPTPT